MGEAESALGWGSAGQGRLPGGAVLRTELRRTLLLVNLHHRQRKRGGHEWLAWGNTQNPAFALMPLSQEDFSNCA